MFKKLMRDSLARQAKRLYPDGSPARNQRAAFVRYMKSMQPRCY